MTAIDYTVVAACIAFSFGIGYWVAWARAHERLTLATQRVAAAVESEERAEFLLVMGGRQNQATQEAFLQAQRDAQRKAWS